MRIKGLDFLRGLAIILVLFRHADMGNNPLYHFGWLGVDLFFVLSGFLVSGLLFKEYLRSDQTRIKRFLIRRGFKIYPPFYFFMLFTIGFHWFETHTFYDTNKILSELFYVQSYFPRIWIHTWSLAVEEHFYLVLAVFIWLSVKYRFLKSKSFVIPFLVALIILSFFLRWQVSYPHRNDAIFGFVQTHLRADGILIGVLISYLYYFTKFKEFFYRYKRLFLVLAIALILPAFYYKAGGFFMNTLGLSLVNIGFGVFTLLSLDPKLNSINNPNKILSFVINFIALIGVHSYSVYLWHLNAKHFIGLLLEPTSAGAIILYFILAISLGIGLSLIIEKPILKLRDKITK
jgi:peptidoglycan/LPS O-acetylase OafA/YrhL